jgi:sugar-specific transcriptional regulator TrmB
MLLGMQYLVQQLSTSPKQRRTEHFQTSLDDTPNEKVDKINKDDTQKNVEEKEKETEKESSKDAKLRILDQVQTVFDNYSPTADQKSKIFDVLMNKEHFEQLKTLKPVDLQKYITDFVSDKLEGKKTESFEEDQDRTEMDEELDNLQDLAKKASESIDNFIAPKKEDFQDSNKILNDLDDIAKKIEALQKHIKETEQVKSLVPPITKATSPSVPVKKESKPLIEGFDNRMQFAFI